MNNLLNKLDKLDFSKSYLNDFLMTWHKSNDELNAVFLVADALRKLREENKETSLYKSGLAISLFRDSSTRTRFSYSSAANLLGMEVQDLDEGKSQIVHGETVRETSNMISFMADVIGIRDCYNIGASHGYMQEVADSVQAGYEEGVLEQRPTVVNLQCDMDHPTQSMSDALHLINTYGGVENLRGKKIAMSWAYSPTYGKPLSVAQGTIGLMGRLGMDISLAYPEGYGLQPETMEIARKNAAEYGTNFTVTNNMSDAFEGADIVYPKSWAPYAVLEERTTLHKTGRFDEIKELEGAMLTENAKHKDWECTEEMMKKTKDGKALYMHCLPADITGVSCKEGEVEASVFDRYRVPLYKEASYKPYIIAAMMTLSKVKDPVRALRILNDQSGPRSLFQ